MRRGRQCVIELGLEEGGGAGMKCRRASGNGRARAAADEMGGAMRAPLGRHAGSPGQQKR